MTATNSVRVCLVTQRWAPSFSGAGLRFQQYLPRLRAQGIDVSVVCSADPGDASAELEARWRGLRFGETLHTCEPEGTNVQRVKLPQRRSTRRNLVFGRAVLRHLDAIRPDVAQYLALGPLRMQRRRDLSRTGVSTVFTGTQLWTLSANPLKRSMQQWWIRSPLKKADHIAVSSTVMRAFYESIGVTTPASVIPNGVDLDRFQPASTVEGKEAAREELGIPTTANVVVFIGSIIYRKGVDLLLEAFSRVASADPLAVLVLVGPRGDGEQAEDAGGFDKRIDDLVRSSSAPDRIRFTGLVPTVDTYLRAADVFVLPSRREGMGNVVLEAMASGIATVLTPYLGLPDELGRAGSEYVLTRPDPQSLAAHLQALLRDHQYRRSIGAAGRRWVLEHLSISAAVDAYARIYRDLATYGMVRPENR